VRVSVTAGSANHPVVTPTDHPGVRAAAEAMREVFGVEPYYTREGGSIHPVEMFDRMLGMPTVLAGFGLPDDRIHAPNEKFDLVQFHSGIRVLTRLWDGLAEALPRPATVVPRSRTVQTRAVGSCRRPRRDLQTPAVESRQRS
jgi:acetylornithine deacetylase/succinyl-diaminopimelate desuccinylase-like protein